jgi:hypothetical protein
MARIWGAMTNQILSPQFSLHLCTQPLLLREPYPITVHLNDLSSIAVHAKYKRIAKSGTAVN